MPDATEPLQDGRARRSASLSFIAAGVTAGVFAWAIFADSSSLTVWLIRTSLPPIAFSIAAAFQYRRTTKTGAGTTAAIVYWLFVVVFYVQGGLVFVPGALLQTAAWFISRSTSHRGAAVHVNGG